MGDSVLLPVRVECYAGSRAFEEPRAVWVAGVRRRITEVRDRWYQGSVDPSVAQRDYWKVVTDDGERRLLAYDRGERVWYEARPVPGGG